ncbi:hypothetical protein [Novosphingobium sp.]|nr:hypothetical protein [Novosphingobium sp.]
MSGSTPTDAHHDNATMHKPLQLTVAAALMLWQAQVAHADVAEW